MLINKNLMTYNIIMSGYNIIFRKSQRLCISRDDLYMKYDTETYSLEIVFTFRNDPSLSRHFKLPHGLSSAEACGVLFSLKCAGCTTMRKSALFI